MKIRNEQIMKVIIVINCVCLYHIIKYSSRCKEKMKNKNVLNE